MIYQRNDTNQNTLDAIVVQESHFGEYEYLQKEHGYICYFVNESLNRYHGTCIIIRDTYLQTNIQDNQPKGAVGTEFIYPVFLPFVKFRLRVLAIPWHHL